ncbi:hypothetical protein btf_190 [Dehalococcoides mccartyi BTF08]|nr:hypothetical protein btf_190 [Dehalococcoides mccartyi BTF08]
MLNSPDVEKQKLGVVMAMSETMSACVKELGVQEEYRPKVLEMLLSGGETLGVDGSVGVLFSIMDQRKARSN